MSKKLFVITSIITITVWSIGLAAVPLAFGAAPTAGSIIKMPCTNAKPPVQPTGCDAVYYLGEDGNRYVFPNAKIYNSWYTDFLGVQDISKGELESYPIKIGKDGQITYRPGTKLVKANTDPKVYAVTKMGGLRWIKGEDAAKAVFGADWAKMIDDIPDSFLGAYTEQASNPIDSADDYNKTTEMNASPNISTDKGIGTGGPVGAGSKLTIALAADTPASSIAVENALRVPFTKFTLTAGADGDIVVDTITIQRVGLGQDAAFAGVDLVDLETNTPINETAKTFNSDHKASYTDDITVSAGKTKSFLLAGNMAASLDAYAGETPALSVVDVTLKGAGSVTGLPASGNYQTTNGTITIGTATVQRGAYTNATSTTIEVGKANYTFFSFKIANGSTEDITFTQVKVYQQGTASLPNDMENIKLFGQKTAGGAQEEIATGTTKGNYVTFNFSQIKLKKGDTHQYEVRASVKGGSVRTVILGIYRNTDLLVKGETYGYNITPTYSGTGSSGGNPVLMDNSFTISNGSLEVAKTNDVPTGNITVSNGQEVGSYKFTVKGEAIDITAITLTVASTVATAASVIEDATKGWKIVDPAGKVVAGPVDVTNNTLQARMTDTWTAPVGDTIYKIVADVATNGGFASDDSLTVAFTPSNMTARGVSTGNTITPTPSSALTSNTRTIKAAAITVTRNSLPATGNIIVGSSQALLGSWNFDATNAGEDIRITSLAIAASSTNVGSLTLYDGAKALSPINDAPTMTADNRSTGNDSGTTTFTLSEPIIVKKGALKNIDLKGNVLSAGAAGEVVEFGITDSSASVTSYGATTGNSATVTVTADDGPLLTFSASGALTVTAYNNPDITRVKAGSTGNTVFSIKLDALHEKLDLDELYIKLADGAASGTGAGAYTDISMVYLYDGSTLLASGPLGATDERKFTFTDNILVVDRNSNKVLTIKADYAVITSTDNQPGSSNADTRLGIGGRNGIKMTGVDSGQSATETATSVVGATSSAMILHAAVPVVTLPTTAARNGAASVLANGESVLYAFKVKGDSYSSVNRSVMLYSVTFLFTTTAGVDITNLRLEDDRGYNIGHTTTISRLTDAADTSGSLLQRFFLNANEITGYGDQKEHVEVANAAERTFKLYGTISGATSPDTLTVALMGDTASSGLGSTRSPNGNTADNFTLGYGNKSDFFVWSDDWRNYSGNNSATGQKMWFNGYRINGMGASKTTSAYVISL